jgi:hypothetical protein
VPKLAAAPLDRCYNVGMAYDRELPACFSQHDLLLAMGEAEEQRAFRWLAILRERQTTWPAVKAQIEEFLRERDAGRFTSWTRSIALQFS